LGVGAIAAAAHSQCSDGIAVNSFSRDRRLACIGAIAWPSFFAAAAASVVFFAIVDPSELAEITWPHLTISRKLGYSIGFFMFWACTFGSSRSPMDPGAQNLFNVPPAHEVGRWAPRDGIFARGSRALR